MMLKTHLLKKSAFNQEEFKMKKLTIIALTLITLGATSQIVEKNIDKEEVKTVVTSNLKENDQENEELYFQHENDEKASLIEKIGF